MTKEPSFVCWRPPVAFPRHKAWTQLCRGKVEVVYAHGRPQASLVEEEKFTRALGAPPLRFEGLSGLQVNRGDFDEQRSD